MRTLFWRVFASFWLAIVLVAGLSLLLGRVFNQDALILATHPALRGLAEQWVELYESQGAEAAQRLLEKPKRRYRLDVQVLGDDGEPLVRGTFPPRAAALEARVRENRLPWRRLTESVDSPGGATYLFIYRIPHPELHGWQRDSVLLPLGALAIALLVLTILSLRLTLSITRPLERLRSAVHDLGRTAYQQHSLDELARRPDELGLLARDFNHMGERLQGLIGSQRQLLRDVSHELRSPLARLKIALALAERAPAEEREQLWPRLGQECDRLEALIQEILTLARLDSEPGARQPVPLRPLLEKLIEDARLLHPEQQIRLDCPESAVLSAWPDMLERALDNLLRNALRFNPVGQPVEIRVTAQAGAWQVEVRDHGPGVADEYLARLGEPFFRAPQQSGSGHGLGLAIVRRSAERHGGHLELVNHVDGGFVARLTLPR